MKRESRATCSPIPNKEKHKADMSKKNKYRSFAQFPEMHTVKEIVLYGAEHGKDKKQYMFENFDGEVETKTFGQVFHDVHGFGQMLYTRGLRGKKVAILSENSYYWIGVYYAIITGKMTAIPLDPKLHAEDLTELRGREEIGIVLRRGALSGAAEAGGIGKLAQAEIERLLRGLAVEAHAALFPGLGVDKSEPGVVV